MIFCWAVFTAILGCRSDTPLFKERHLNPLTFNIQKDWNLLQSFELNNVYSRAELDAVSSKMQM